jgi:hypothetical protein
VRILAHVSHQSFELLASTLPSKHGVARLNDLRRLSQMLESTEHDILVVDPLPIRPDAFAFLLRELAGTSIAVAWFTRLEAVDRILKAAAVEFGEVVLRGFSEDPPMLRRRFEAAYAGSAPGALLRHLWSSIRRFPKGIREQAVALLGGAPIPWTVPEFATRSGSSRRAVDRWMAAVGISSAGDFLDATRIARSSVILGDNPLAHDADLEAAGYEHARTAHDHYKRFLELTPRMATRSLRGHDIGNLLARALLRGGARFKRSGGQPEDLTRPEIGLNG